MENQRPKVGVGIVIRKGRMVLMGKRKNAHGDGTWNFPGGHLEFGESVEDCARREVLEETGLVIDNLKRSKFTNDIFEKENKHYVTLYVIADWKDGVPEIKEPDVCEEWKWFEWGNLPEPLFLSDKNLLEDGFSPFE